MDDGADLTSPPEDPWAPDGGGALPDRRRERAAALRDIGQGSPVPSRGSLTTGVAPTILGVADACGLDHAVVEPFLNHDGTSSAPCTWRAASSTWEPNLVASSRVTS